MSISAFIATVGYVGHLRPAPGTWGSLVALPLAWMVAQWAGFAALAVLTIAMFFVGTWSVIVQTSGKPDHDPSEIVIDELVGQWVALLPVIYGATMMQAELLALWPGWISAFLLFRFFDITKLGPIGWADRRNDPLGVMLDDVIAGLFAAAGVLALAAIAHGVL